MAIKVLNLATGKEVEYVISPEKAVVCAHEQFTRRNWNTWDYDFSQAVVSNSGKTVRCGDWAAVRDMA